MLLYLNVSLTEIYSNAILTKKIQKYKYFVMQSPSRTCQLRILLHDPP